MWGRGQAGTLAALQDVEASACWRFCRCWVWTVTTEEASSATTVLLLALQQRRRPVFMTRSRPYKKDDNAHVEQKNWTHVRQCFGYERHDNHEVVGLMNEVAKGAYGQLLNYFHASLKLGARRAERADPSGFMAKAQTPLARVLASAHVTAQTKQRLRKQKAGLNPFALKQAVTRSLKGIDAWRWPNGDREKMGRQKAPRRAPVLLRRVRPLRSETRLRPPAPGKAGNAGGLTVRVSLQEAKNN